MTDRLSNVLQFHQTALSLRAQRQEVLAANVANADTPNYKARDFDFRSALQSALGSAARLPAPQSGGAIPVAASTSSAAVASAVSRTDGRHLAGNAGATSGGVPLQYRSVMQGSLDQNTVEMDVERNHFADNALRYEASVTLVNGQIKSLMTAIQG